MPPPAEGIASRIFVGPALRTQSDRRLVTLVRDGYEAAFEEIVRRYGAPLGRYARAIVGGHAEDVTQDAFSKALLALRRDGAEIELRPWLYRIVRNTALNDLRDRPPAAQELTEPLAHTGSVSEEVERREEVAELTRRLRELPEPQRAAIVMRELEGLGHEEIAAALGVTGGAARQTIHRARTALRDAVGAAIPLPLLRVLIDHGAEASAAGAGAGGAAAAAGGSIGSAGAGGVLKAGLATALIAGSVGTGLVVHRDRHELHASAARAATVPSARASEVNGGGEPGDDSSHGGSSGPGSSGPSDHSGPGRSGARDDDGEASSNSGPGSDRDLSGGDERLSEHSGSGRSGSGDGSGEESLSGSGSGGSDSNSGPGSGEPTLSGGDSSGPGSGDLLPVPGDSDSSGPGDGSFSDGTSGSGTSGSGSDDGL